MIMNAQIIDSGANISDHRPLVYSLQLLLHHKLIVISLL